MRKLFISETAWLLAVAVFTFLVMGLSMGPSVLWLPAYLANSRQVFQFFIIFNVPLSLAVYGIRCGFGRFRRAFPVVVLSIYMALFNLAFMFTGLEMLFGGSFWPLAIQVLGAVAQVALLARLAWLLRAWRKSNDPMVIKPE